MLLTDAQLYKTARGFPTKAVARRHPLGIARYVRHTPCTHFTGLLDPQITIRLCQNRL